MVILSLKISFFKWKLIIYTQIADQKSIYKTTNSKVTKILRNNITKLRNLPVDMQVSNILTRLKIRS